MFTGPTATPSPSGQFVALTPERIYDTRINTMVNASTFWEATGIRSGTVYIPGLDQVQAAVFISGYFTT